MIQDQTLFQPCYQARQRIHRCSFTKVVKKRGNHGILPYETLILLNANQISMDMIKEKQISACTLGTSDIIHSGAVETLFLMLSCLSDIPRPHLKWTRHDKKKQRGKSRQRTSGAVGTTYVELSVHNNVCL